MQTKGIVVVSFGTSYIEAIERGIDPVEKAIADDNPDAVVVRAFTSERVRKKLKERDGIEVDTLQQALERLENSGIEEILVQPLHILPGIEYEKIQKVAEREQWENKIRLGSPLLYGREDYEAVTDALRSTIPQVEEGAAVLLIGHGTPHCSNACYYWLQHACTKVDLPVYIGTVEGSPDFEDVLEELQKNRIEKVILFPFMLVAGDHVHHDLEGEADSWAEKLRERGIAVETIYKGLGEYPAFQKIYVEKVRRLLENR